MTNEQPIPETPPAACSVCHGKGWFTPPLTRARMPCPTCAALADTREDAAMTHPDSPTPGLNEVKRQYYTRPPLTSVLVERFEVRRGRKVLGTVFKRPIYGTWDAVRRFEDGGFSASGFPSRYTAADWLDKQAKEQEEQEDMDDTI